MLEQYMKKLGLTDVECEVFLLLYKLGMQPASVIARHASMERTTVYKMLLRMNKLGIVSQTKRRGVLMFFVPDLTVIQSYLQRKEQELSDLSDNFAAFEAEVRSRYGTSHLNVPRITLFDGQDKIANLYNDILKEITDSGYRFLRMFASNTHTEQLANVTMKDIASRFFAEIKKQGVVLDAHIADGSLTMERISKRSRVEDILGLPASASATNIFVVGASIYLLIFKDEPIGIKIKNQELAQSFHFLFDKLTIEG